MNLLEFFLLASSGSTTEKTIKRYFHTTFNGDLSPTALDQLQVFTTDSLAVKNNTAYLYYVGNGQGDGVTDVDLNFVATKDLTTGEIYEGWTRYKDGNPDAIPILSVGGGGSWDEKQVFVRTVFYDTDDSIFKMWYTGENTSSVFATGYATSSDGFAWTKEATNPVYENTTPFVGKNVFFAVYKESPTLYHAVASGNRNVYTVGAVYLTSTDGINWTEQQNPILSGVSNLRSVVALRKIGSAFYLYCEYGFNTSYSQNITGIPTDTRIYRTADFLAFNDLGSLQSKIEPQEAGLMGASIFEYNAKFYYMYSYFKNQVKAINSGGGDEPFMAFRIIESNGEFTQPIEIENEYPSYLKKYYPLFNEPETQAPIEIIDGDSPTVTGTLSWNFRKYCEFDGTQTLEYPNYTPSDVTNFAVKARISETLTGGPHIVRQDNLSDNRFWTMYLNATGLLVVILFDASNNIAKNYRTTLPVSKPTGISDIYDELSVGFIFNNGQLDVLFGDGIQPVTKVTDDPLTEISPKNTPVVINANALAVDIRSVCIFDTITEDQWLNVIDL
jgi:hypothetical protein